VREDEDHSLFGREPAEAAIEPVTVIDRDRLVRPTRSIDREDTDIRVPAAHAARFRIARIDEEALQPGVEAVRIAEAGQLTPGDHQRLLHGILGPSDIPEDPLRDRHEPVAMRSRQDGECLPVTALRLLHEIAIQQIVLHGAHRGHLPTLLSRGGHHAFKSGSPWRHIAMLSPALLAGRTLECARSGARLRLCAAPPWRAARRFLRVSPRASPRR
jgi:hypothetical protein